MKFLRHITAIAGVFLAATEIAAQPVSVLNPLASSYSMSGFVYTPPVGAGWREIRYAPDAVEIVYAEQVNAESVNKRAHFTAQAFPIEDPTVVTGPAQLADASMKQRKDEKGESLVASSPLLPVDGKVPAFEYTLIVKVDGEDYVENYIVALAPDKSHYLAARLVTKDADYREQPYYAPLRASLASLSFPTIDSATPPAVPDAAPAAD